MAKTIVLGGCGVVGRVAVKTLATSGEFDEVIIGDINGEEAGRFAEELGGENVRAAEVDVLDKKALRAAISGCDVVLNCSGPFYKLLHPVVEAVIEEGVNYVDVCDDVDVTLEIFESDGRAKEAGVTALIGMGSSPGATNLLAKYAADNLLEKTDSIDIFHAHGGEPVEGPGVIGHRFHCMSIDIPMFLDGELRYVKFFEEDGISLRQKFEFPVVGELELYPYPHPEQVTLPRYIECRRVTNKGTVIPSEYYDLIRDVCELGLGGGEPLDVGGNRVSPHDFAAAFLIRERERILEETGFGSQRGCASVVVKGTKTDGEPREYRFHMASESEALGEGTGIPAAIGAILMRRGLVSGPGVMPPEACVDPLTFMGYIPQIMKLDEGSGGDGSFSGVIIDSIDAEGNVKRMKM